MKSKTNFGVFWRRLLRRWGVLSLNSMGPTPTRTLGMLLSCNFVNVYTCTRAHPQRTSSRGKARIGQKSADFVGELNGPRTPRHWPVARAAAVGLLR